jgi:RNA ligase
MTDTLETTLNRLALTKPPLVKCANHTSLPLKIYNYTSQTQYQKHWTPETLMARGLVLESGTSTIIARPMKTFFNHDAGLHIPPTHDLTFTALEKVDGSLGLWFCYRGEWMMATRGSFANPQTKEGTEIARELRLAEKCDARKTYCFEILYPANKILVNYGERRELVLLAVIDTVSGFDEPNSALAAIAHDLGVRVARTFDTTTGDVEALQELDLENEEGVVVRFNENGERVKVKFPRYMELVKAANTKPKVSLSEKVLEALLKDPMSRAETMLDSLPDEYYDELRATVEDFSRRFEEAQKEFDRVVVDYALVTSRDIPDTLPGKPSLCKWLKLARNGNGSVGMKDSVRMEYAVEVVRRKLRVEGKLKKAASKKR